MYFLISLATIFSSHSQLLPPQINIIDCRRIGLSRGGGFVLPWIQFGDPKKGYFCSYGYFCRFFLLWRLTADKRGLDQAKKNEFFIATKNRTLFCFGYIKRTFFMVHPVYFAFGVCFYDYWTGLSEKKYYVACLCFLFVCPGNVIKFMPNANPVQTL